MPTGQNAAGEMVTSESAASGTTLPTPAENKPRGMSKDEPAEVAEEMRPITLKRRRAKLLRTAMNRSKAAYEFFATVDHPDDVTAADFSRACQHLEIAFNDSGELVKLLTGIEAQNLEDAQAI